MSRNIKHSNIEIFTILDRHCSTRGQTLLNAGKARWIASEKSHKHFMANARLCEVIHFGPGRKLARFELLKRSYLCSVGFEPNQVLESGAEQEMTPAYLTVLLSELQPRPSASISEIRQIVEWSDKDSDNEYEGHEHQRIASLFPQARIYEISHMDKGSTWNIFLRFCVDECDFGSSWIEGRLVETLRSMCDLDQQRIPYRVLCRSIFDGDQSSFFLALYRCLEALYAYSSAHSLAVALEIKRPWSIVATVLEEALGWHPREEGSLVQIMKFATDNDLNTIVTNLGQFPTDNQELLVSRAAKSVYGLRNSIVHYRPAQQSLEMDRYNWSQICEAMVGIIIDVYQAVFTTQEV